MTTTTGNHQPLTGLPTRKLPVEAFSLAGGNYHSLPARTGPGLVLVDAPGPLVQYTERGRAMNESIGRKQS